MKRAFVKLYIDTQTYKQEAGCTLTKARLQEIAEDVNYYTTPIYGYESYEFGFEDAN